MQCPVCNHENGDAQFCERCGTNLTQTTSSPSLVKNPESAAASEPEYTRWSSTQNTSSEAPVRHNTPSVSIHKEQTRESTGTNDHASAGDNSSNQWNNIVQNEKVQQAKEVSKQYLSYFLSVLARPYQTMKTVGDQHSLNGWLTMALIAVLSSTYFLITFSRIGMDGLFIGGFVRPLLFTVIILIASIALMYAILKIEKITFRPKTLVAQFGTLLVPAVVSLVLANLFIIISYSIAIALLVVSYIIIFVALNSVLFQYPLNRTKAAIDSMYSVLIANVVVFFILYRLLGEVIIGLIGLMLSPFGRL
ncbi:zinc ribbon domain-containing protein [Paenibacillus sp. 1781tsa1]|uniref:zinc ribbon domain-containing protein n=1 Tax=Paenibacillus sp. 1781tsa1 TaxID=2953810 RepID=UPI0020A1742B|nr:zinc ribbon domain-containing protein [Paenibacillus sp. 1781tsa1]MCP1187150.1 zinc ribbon domain-containing protein [Paenibacillus sp. 1781tsa1]